MNTIYSSSFLVSLYMSVTERFLMGLWLLFVCFCFGAFLLPFKGTTQNPREWVQNLITWPQLALREAERMWPFICVLTYLAKNKYSVLKNRRKRTHFGTDNQQSLLQVLAHFSVFFSYLPYLVGKTLSLLMDLNMVEFFHVCALTHHVSIFEII